MAISTIESVDLFHHLSKEKGQTTIDPITTELKTDYCTCLKRSLLQVDEILTALPKEWNVSIEIVREKLKQLFEEQWISETWNNFIIRPEISERLSVGLIIVDGNTFEMRYSREKLDALKYLFSDKEYKFISRVITSLMRNHSINSIEAVNYLTRYSNNLISVSPLQNIDVTSTKTNKDWLFKTYVYDSSKVVA